MFGLALGWLLPNHYLPWTAFHTEVWVAWGLLLGSWAVLLLAPGLVRLQRSALFACIIACVPSLQFAFSIIPFAGQAWLTTAYLMGFALAIVLGAHSEAAWPNVGLDMLLGAICIAAIASVGLQLYQWLDLAEDGLGLWILVVPNARPFANLGQPNQLATLLVWGLIAVGYGHQRRVISGRIAFALGFYLLFGVALTQSRTAFVAVLGLVLAAWYWRRLMPSTAYFVGLIGLAALYLCSLFALPLLSDAIGLAPDLGMASRTGQELRLPAYKLFWDAVGQRPWAGYGWAPTVVAQLAVAERHGSLGAVFSHSHNLFLDLLLWCGVPLGGMIALLMMTWFFQKFRRVDSFQDAILLAFVAAVAWHAMLEFPLHYAYMLLPLGVVVGVLNTRMNEPIWILASRWQVGVAMLAAVCLLGAITRDYLRVEQNFLALRFERARIGVPQEEPMASVWLLGHMNDFVRMGRTTARPNLTPEELTWMRHVSGAFPSHLNLFIYAKALAMNRQAAEARRLIGKLSRMCTPEEYAQMKRVWEAQAQEDMSLAEVSWPERAIPPSQP